MAEATNDNEITTVDSAALWGTITWVSLQGTATGYTEFIGASALDTARTPAVGRGITFAAGELDIILRDRSQGGEFGAFGARRALRGALGSGTTPVYVAYHTGDPGDDGDQDEVSGGGYARPTDDAQNLTIT